MKKLQLLKNKKLLLAVAGTLIIIITIVLLTRPKADVEEKAIWREYPVTFNDITASLDGGGALETDGVPHSFDVDIKVEQILVTVGQEVKVGDVLVKYSVDALKEKIAELNVSLQKAQRLLEDAKNNKQKTQLENRRELENTTHTANQKMKQLQEKMTKLKQDLAKAAASSDGSIDSGELKRLKDLLANLQAEMKWLEQKGSSGENDEQIASLKQQQSSLKTQLKEITTQIDAIIKNTDKLNALKQQLATIQGELSLVRAQIKNLPVGDPGLADLQAKEAELVKKEGELKTAIGGFQDESVKLDELKKQKTDFEKQISSINVQINSLENTVSDANVIQEKRMQIEEMQKKITVLSSKEEKIKSLKEQMDQTRIDLEAAQFELDKQSNKEGQTLQEQITIITDDTLDNAVQNAKDDVEKIRKDLAKAKEILTIPELTAKADGAVTELKCAEGDEVLGGKPIVIVGNNGKKHVVTRISQEDIGGVEVGQSVEMQFLASPDETLKGKVSEKSLVPSEGGDGITYKVTITFDGEQPELLQGMTCSVKFILKRVEHVLTLSNKAIALENGKQIVTVLLADGTHKEREIKTGFSDGRVSEITDGLSDGETVVTAG